MFNEVFLLLNDNEVIKQLRKEKEERFPDLEDEEPEPLSEDNDLSFEQDGQDGALLDDGP